MNHFRQGIKNIPEICVKHGIKRVVLSPGSRNAPLIFAFTSHPTLECISIIDERTAAYFALGMAQKSPEPIALVCTSGSAVLNFAPAISEAYYQNLPLVVFTADRPAEWIDQADGQTIRQKDIFVNYIKSGFELPVETLCDEDLYFCNRQVSQAIDTATSYPKGPVHINVPLREPIYCALPQNHSNPSIIKQIISTPEISKNHLLELQKEWTTFNRKMVIFGVLPKSDEYRNLALLLASQPDVVVITENLSNITGENIITCPESLFANINSLENKEAYQPDLLITIGNSVICKQLKMFLRTNKPTQQWQFESTLPYVDTYKSLSTIIPGNASNVLYKMPQGKTVSNYSSQFLAQMKIVGQRHEQYLSKNTLNPNNTIADIDVVSALLQVLSSETTLHLANSTSVRWTQLFSTRPDITYICNRGTSGIDGSMSTAAGYAYLSHKPTVFLTGDLSFIYDSNAFWNNFISNRLKIIVMNNNGGNIFRFIGDAELMSKSLEFFTTPHKANIKLLTEAFGVAYRCCDDMKLLRSEIVQVLELPNACVLEIKTDAEINTMQYKNYFKSIKEN